jgi:TolB protein
MGVRIRRLSTGAVASVVAAGSLLVVAPAASATFPGRNGRIAFVDSGGDISTVRSDGTGFRRLTSTGDNGDPAWNPAGTKIAFHSRRTGNGDLFIMDADGSHLVQVTHRTTDEGNPQWSADGRQLAFTSDRTGAPQIFRIPVLPSIGTSVQLTAKFDGAGFFSVAWAPDGSTIFGGFISSDFDGDDVTSLYRFSAVDGSRLRYVTSGEEPDVRPQGDRIVYRAGAYTNVFTANLDGTGVVQVTHDTPRASGDVWNPDPTWSPSGALLAYTHIDGAHPTENGLYVSRADGTGARRLLRNGGSPAWQPRP